VLVFLSLSVFYCLTGTFDEKLMKCRCFAKLTKDGARMLRKANKRWRIYFSFKIRWED